MKLFINEQRAYPWHKNDKGLFRGFFIIDEEVYAGDKAIVYLYQKIRGLSFNQVASIIRSMDGLFAFVIFSEDDIVFGGDRLRGLPTFYSIQAGELWIGNDIDKMISTLQSPKINNTAVKELLDSCLFVLGSDTLVENVFQVRAAELCVFNKKTEKLERTQYYKSEHDDFYDDNDLERISAAFKEAYNITGKNMVKILSGRTAVVPLSGGADSRMIVDMLKKQNYEKVICYTYGKEGNPESEMSRKVAEEYGYEWHIIQYTAEEIAKLRIDSETEAYSDYAFMYCTTPHFQDYYAVRELKRRNIIPEDSVFVPGHSGDIPNGNHVSPLYMKETVDKEECLKSMARFAFTMRPYDHKSRILEEYYLPEEGTPQQYASIEEWLDTAERQAKFIVHSARVYEFFGYEWLIPLWDNTQFDFWKRISLKWRYKRRLYYLLVNDKLPSTNDLTTKKQIEGVLRKLPVIHQLASRTRRIQNWWISPLQLEQYYSFSDYFKACFTEKSTFDFNTLYSKKMIKELRKRIK